MKSPYGLPILWREDEAYEWGEEDLLTKKNNRKDDRAKQEIDGGINHARVIGK